MIRGAQYLGLYLEVSQTLGKLLGEVQASVCHSKPINHSLNDCKIVVCYYHNRGYIKDHKLVLD